MTKLDTSQTENTFLPGHSTVQDWSSDPSSGHSVPPLATSLVLALVLVWLPVPSRALQEVPQSDHASQVAHSQSTRRSSHLLNTVCFIILQAQILEFHFYFGPFK